jgi:hypothetical protein
MNLIKILAELRREREQIDEAIMSLERLVAGSGRRRGRPPKWLKAYKHAGRPPASKEKTPNKDKTAQMVKSATS